MTNVVSLQRKHVKVLVRALWNPFVRYHTIVVDCPPAATDFSYGELTVFKGFTCEEDWIDMQHERTYWDAREELDSKAETVAQKGIIVEKEGVLISIWPRYRIHLTRRLRLKGEQPLEAAYEYVA